MGKEKVKVLLEEWVSRERVEGEELKYASNLSSGWEVGLEKESKGGRVSVNELPAVWK